MFESAAAIYFVIATTCASAKHTTLCLVYTDVRPVTREECIAHGKILNAGVVKMFKTSKYKGPYTAKIECKLLKDKPVETESASEESQADPEESTTEPAWYVRVFGWFLSLIF